MGCVACAGAPQPVMPWPRRGACMRACVQNLRLRWQLERHLCPAVRMGRTIVAWMLCITRQWISRRMNVAWRCVHARVRVQNGSVCAHQVAPPSPLRSVQIEVDLGVGSESFTVIGSDLTHEYVSVNADYRS